MVATKTARPCYFPDMLAAASPLAPTVAALGDAVRRSLVRLAEARFRLVQLDATRPGLRPRDLDASARRDLRATLRRHELELAGLDAFVPVRDLADPVTMDRAVAALLGAIDLAGDLGRITVSLALPEDGADELVAPIAAAAAARGVILADHRVPAGGTDDVVRRGVDPAAILAAGGDPVAEVHAHARRLGAARLVDLLRSGHRGPVGDPSDGRLDVLAYRVALSAAGWDGPVVLDARRWAAPWEGVLRSREVWEG